jgi:hypothetical protein
VQGLICLAHTHPACPALPLSPALTPPSRHPHPLFRAQFSRKRFDHVWPITFLRWFGVIFFQVLDITSMAFFMMVLDCQYWSVPPEMQGHNAEFPQQCEACILIFDGLHTASRCAHLASQLTLLSPHPRCRLLEHALAHPCRSRRHLCGVLCHHLSRFPDGRDGAQHDHNEPTGHGPLQVRGDVLPAQVCDDCCVGLPQQPQVALRSLHSRSSAAGLPDHHVCPILPVLGGECGRAPHLRSPRDPPPLQSKSLGFQPTSACAPPAPGALRTMSGQASMQRCSTQLA